MLNVKTISLAAMLSATLTGTNVCAYEFEKVAPESVGFDSVKLENADTKLKQLYSDGRIPNYVLNLYKDGKLYYSATGGLTNLEEGEPVDDYPRMLHRGHSLKTG